MLLGSLTLLGLTSLAATGTPTHDLQAGPLAEWKMTAGGNGHYYQAIYSAGGVDWHTANAYAMAHSGYLATISSSAENIFIFNLVDEPKYWGWLSPYNNRNLGPWLGGQRQPGSPRPEDGWIWIHDGLPFTYTNWAQTEPDYGGLGGEDYLHYMSYTPNDRVPTWNDVGPEYKMHGLVVEYDLLPGVETSGVRVGLVDSTAKPDATEATSGLSAPTANYVVRNLGAIQPSGVNVMPTPYVGPVLGPVAPPVSANSSNPALSTPGNYYAPYTWANASTRSAAETKGTAPHVAAGLFSNSVAPRPAPGTPPLLWPLIAVAALVVLLCLLGALFINTNRRQGRPSDKIPTRK